MAASATGLPGVHAEALNSARGLEGIPGGNLLGGLMSSVKAAAQDTANDVRQ